MNDVLISGGRIVTAFDDYVADTLLKPAPTTYF